MKYLIIMHKPTGELDRVTEKAFSSLDCPWEYTVLGSEWE